MTIRNTGLIRRAGFFCIALVCCAIVTLPVRADDEPDVLNDEGKASFFCGHVHQQIAIQGMPRGLMPETDVRHCRLDLEILPQTDLGGDYTAVEVAGVNTMTVDVVGASVSQFNINLSSNLITVNVTGAVSSWVHQNDIIEVTLDRAYTTGETFELSISYEGEPDVQGFGAFKWWTRNGNLVVATLSEPYYAPQWWPCKDTLDDKITMEMIITAPDPMIGVSNGVLLSTTPLGDGRTRYHWHEMNQMTSYLASLAITNYERYDLTYNYIDENNQNASMPVPCYVYPDHWDFGLGQPAATSKTGCDELLTMLAVFEDLYGPYPFRNEKYGVAETGDSGDALQANMEHQTISSMWRVRSYTDIMAHELGHQWWGDDVTCGTWQDIWLNEAFASYSECLYREFRPGGSQSSYWNRVNARRPSNPDARVYRTNVNSVNAIFSTNDVYNKGCWTVHMLRHVLGDADFFGALSAYRESHSDGYAKTEDFAGVFSSYVGHDMFWFTNQWVLSPGSPDYEWAWASESIDGNSFLKLSVVQTQDSRGYGMITMPIDLRVTTSNGIVNRKIWNDDWSESYVIEVPGSVVSVEFDELSGVDDRNYVLTHSKTELLAMPDIAPVVTDAKATAISIPENESSIAVTFSEDIGMLDAGDLTLVGASTGSFAPSNVTYSPGTQTASVRFANLPNDAFTLTLLSSEISANGIALDGEIDDSAWYDNTLLPSGDGQPGGDAVLAFELVAGDANCDESVKLDDVPVFVDVLLGFDASPCHVLRSDANNDGQVDGRDIALIVSALVD